MFGIEAVLAVSPEFFFGSLSRYFVVLAGWTGAILCVKEILPMPFAFAYAYTF
jgi:hypothetical protein